MVNRWNPSWGTRTYIMGVLNVTPDSFTGDGLMGDWEAITRRAQQLTVERADLIDVGGESTRPAYVPVPLEEELARTIPVVEFLAANCPLPISIDTTKAEVARRAITAGAAVVNDISGLSDDSMPAIVADSDCSLVLVHNTPVSGAPDVLQFVRTGLEDLVDRAVQSGISESRLLVDPGLGFGKTWKQNLELLSRLSELQVLGLPMLIGPSRKATISRVLGVGVHDRLEGTAALVAISIAQGVDVVRVHDCLYMRRVAQMTDAVARPV